MPKKIGRSPANAGNSLSTERTHKEALVTNRSVYELVIEKDWLTQAQLDDILKPESMTHPRKLAPLA
jgi:aspartate ammonia-lyase